MQTTNSRKEPATPKTDLSSVMFPGRSVLSVQECCDKLGVSVQHLLDLIEEGQLGAIDVGHGKRKHYRIPVLEWEKFLRSRASV